MVNTLQLIIHMNMLSVMVPANVQFFFGFIVNIVNFKIIPTKDIIQKLMGGKEKKEETQVTPEFKQSGYESTNIGQNLGIVLLAIIGLIGIILAILGLRIFAKKF
jgi:hypothetical protein